VKRRLSGGEVILVIYDISDDALRLKVADYLKSKGLVRIQKSAFIGRAPRHLRVDIEAGLRRLARLGREKGGTVNIQLYPLPPSSFQRRVVIGDYLYDEAGGVQLF